MANYPTIPERVGPYEIRERIGEGGMAVVYRAWHSGLHRFEALKVPRPGYGDSEYVQRLLSEARMAARLHHPNIVAIHSISESDAKQHFFAMDLIDGVDLETLLENRTLLPPTEALGIVRQIASALDYAHAQGVIHRDIKPGNILLQEHPERLLSERWTVKVVDFGISRAAEDIDGTRLTKNGMLVGTPEYMSPEQAGSGEIVDYRTDLYSLAVVTYEMLTGSPPFLAGDGVSRMSILMSHVAHPPRPPREIVPEISPALNDAILYAMGKKPADRFVNAKAFLRAAEATPKKALPVETLQIPPIESEDRKSGHFPVAQSPLSSRAVTPTAFEASLKAPKDGPYSSSVAAPLAHTAQSRNLFFAIMLGTGIVCALLWSLMQNRIPSRSQIAPVTLSATATPEASTLVSEETPDAPKTPQATAMPQATATPQTVTRKVVEKRPIAFEHQTRRTSALLRGQTRVVQTGRAGVREVTLQIVTRGSGKNLREISRRVIAQRVLSAPRAQITQIGTQAPRRPARVTSPRREPRRPVTRPKTKTHPKTSVKVRRPREAPLPP